MPFSPSSSLNPWLRRASLIAGGLAVLLLLIAGERQQRSERAVSYWADHSQTVLASIEQIDRRMTEVETTYRGYLLTGDTLDLSSYRSQGERLSSELSALRGLVTDNPRQRERVDSLATEAAAMLAEFDALVMTRAQAGLGAVISAREANAGGRMRLEVTRRGDAILREEQRLLAQRLDQQAEASRRNRWIMVSGTTTALGALLLFLGLVLRESQQQRRVTGALERGNALLRQRTEELDSQVRETAAVSAALAEANRALEGIAVELERERAEAQQANEAKSQFLAAMSHELRTPLNAITGYVELLEMELRGPVNSEQRSDLLRIRRNSEHLLGLINTVLNFARLEAGQVTFDITDVPVAPVLGDLEVLLGPELGRKKIRYEQRVEPEDLVVRADADKMRQILLNLMANAVKFTDAGTITVSARRRDGQIEIDVSDTGRGISAAKIAGIFEPFIQVDRHLVQSSQQGVGLGLAISRDLARHMDGDLLATSVPGEGSTFTLRLPAPPPPLDRTTASGYGEGRRREGAGV